MFAISWEKRLKIPMEWMQKNGILKRFQNKHTAIQNEEIKAFFGVFSVNSDFGSANKNSNKFF